MIRHLRLRLRLERLLVGYWLLFMCMFSVIDAVGPQLVRGNPGMWMCSCVGKLRITDYWQQPWNGPYKPVWDTHGHNRVTVSNEFIDLWIEVGTGPYYQYRRLRAASRRSGARLDDATSLTCSNTCNTWVGQHKESQSTEIAVERNANIGAAGRKRNQIEASFTAWRRPAADGDKPNDF